MRHCSAYGCSNNTQRKSVGITFHRFPKDPDLRGLWTVAVGREDWQPSKLSSLCSAHFKDADFDRTSVSCVRLRAGTVPSLFAFSNQGASEQGKGVRSPPSPGDGESDPDPMDMVYVNMELTEDEDESEPSTVERAERVKWRLAPIDAERVDGRKSFCHRLCDLKTGRRWSVRKRLAVHSGRKLFGCDFCEYACVRRTGLKRHMRTHTGERPYSCGECDYSCSETSTLNQHLATHTGVKLYSCHLCSYRCSRTGHLKQHMAKHTGVKPFECDVCSMRFGHAGNLRQHVARMHGHGDRKT